MGKELGSRIAETLQKRAITQKELASIHMRLNLYMMVQHIYFNQLQLTKELGLLSIASIHPKDYDNMKYL